MKLRTIESPWGRQVTEAALVSAYSVSQCTNIAYLLSRVGDKWLVLIILKLRERSMRFNELKRSIDGISQRMLTLTLRHMERDGLVARTVTPSVPPRVDYALTAVGRSLADPVQALGDWAFANQPLIAAAQARYDAKVDAEA